MPQTAQKKMETRIDFLQWLYPEMAIKILMHLDDSADLIRASAVSQYWKNIVISNGVSKQLCIKKFPEVARITHVTEIPAHNLPAVKDPLVDLDHQAYASLLKGLTSFEETDCVLDPVSASSTDNYPRESIMRTLHVGGDSYWSSKGSYNSETPETLIYRLNANSTITEIDLRMFQASFQMDNPIYSSRFVRFRMGHAKYWKAIDEGNFVQAHECADDKFIWTYTSQIFPVAQESELQRFKLPEPVICIGDYVQIELLGRVQRQASDGKYYICVADVQVMGRQLSPAFFIKFSEPSNSVSLKYCHNDFKEIMESVSSGENYSTLQQAWRSLLDYTIHYNPELVVAEGEHEWPFDEEEFEMDGDDEIDPIL